jgi:hypothetical protein
VGPRTEFVLHQNSLKDLEGQSLVVVLFHVNMDLAPALLCCAEDRAKSGRNPPVSAFRIHI